MLDALEPYSQLLVLRVVLSVAFLTDGLRFALPMLTCDVFLPKGQHFEDTISSNYVLHNPQNDRLSETRWEGN